MIQTIDIDGLHCLCSTPMRKDRIAYILYPMDMLSGWIEPAAEKYGVTIVVITGMDWETAFSPWPAPGVPKGSADFKGGSPAFLDILYQRVISRIEMSLGMDKDVDRTLVGVSMSGLFSLWQWMVCDTFRDIASLSGSFWYEGFVDWIKSQPIPKKVGKGYFLLGNQESKSKVKEFATVGVKTTEIIDFLSNAGIDVEFQSVPGSHIADPIPRLEKAFTALYIDTDW